MLSWAAAAKLASAVSMCLHGMLGTLQFRANVAFAFSTYVTDTAVPEIMPLLGSSCFTCE